MTGLCLLCRERPAEKKNTHFLTDEIIRPALNLNGSTKRDKGFYFRLNSTDPFTNVSIQRSTPIEIVESIIGRAVESSEINSAKKNTAFSIDYKFCARCELKYFGQIEQDFSKKILPYLRRANSPRSKYNEEESFKIRMYVYLQLWRYQECSDVVFMSNESLEIIRNYILNYGTDSINYVKQFPLYVAFLFIDIAGRTEEAYNNEFTYHHVGTVSIKRGNQIHYILLMNDFVVQFFDKEEDIAFYDLYSIHTEEIFLKYLNVNENFFLINIVPDKNRQQYLRNMAKFHSPELSRKIRDHIINKYLFLFGRLPDPYFIDCFVNYLQELPFHADKMSQRGLHNYFIDFLQSWRGGGPRLR